MKKISIAGFILLSIALAGCTSNENELPAGSSTAASSSARVQDSSSSTVSDTESTKTNVEGIAVSASDALKAYPDTSVTSLELEPSLGTYYYEVKGMDDDTEYDVKINAETGDLKKEREEALDDDEKNGVERQEEELSIDGILSIEEAANAAVKAVGKGEAKEWSLEKEMSTTYWEVKVLDGRSETSVKLDAKTGDVLETELDD
ncbi:lipoprotein [Enterococcus florum]|uniref:Lipoprotein n=1 Tax=Enterococcus florum TaxID=2480627 RepID=A0A4V0WPP9_9ENTE|nr:PepSY domain-containing protein [Enterococcus florum]GCF94619.1 lipoprotein [Enterococcus florum]